jgi:hypothetical protein
VVAEPRRRASDIDPAVELFVEERLRDTRHSLRDELAVVGTKIETLRAQLDKAAVQSSLEHAESAARLDSICLRLDGLEDLAVLT